MLTFFFWGLAAVFGLIYLNRYAFKSEVRRLETQDEASWRRAIEVNPLNSGAHARLAEAAYKRGDLDAAIDAWRTAIRTSPHGPFAETWKRALKRALADQQRAAKASITPTTAPVRVANGKSRCGRKCARTAARRFT